MPYPHHPQHQHHQKSHSPSQLRRVNTNSQGGDVRANSGADGVSSASVTHSMETANPSPSSETPLEMETNSTTPLEMDRAAATMMNFQESTLQNLPNPPNPHPDHHHTNHSLNLPISHSPQNQLSPEGTSTSLNSAHFSGSSTSGSSSSTNLSSLADQCFDRSSYPRTPAESLSRTTPLLNPLPQSLPPTLPHQLYNNPPASSLLPPMSSGIVMSRPFDVSPQVEDADMMPLDLSVGATKSNSSNSRQTYSSDHNNQYNQQQTSSSTSSNGSNGNPLKLGSSAQSASRSHRLSPYHLFTVGFGATRGPASNGIPLSRSPHSRSSSPFYQLHRQTPSPYFSYLAPTPYYSSTAAAALAAENSSFQLLSSTNRVLNDLSSTSFDDHGGGTPVPTPPLSSSLLLPGCGSGGLTNEDPEESEEPTYYDLDSSEASQTHSPVKAFSKNAACVRDTATTTVLTTPCTVPSLILDEEQRYRAGHNLLHTSQYHERITSPYSAQALSALGFNSTPSQASTLLTSSSSPPTSSSSPSAISSSSTPISSSPPALMQQLPPTSQNIYMGTTVSQQALCDLSHQFANGESLQKSSSSNSSSNNNNSSSSNSSSSGSSSQKLSCTGHIQTNNHPDHPNHRFAENNTRHQKAQTISGIPCIVRVSPEHPQDYRQPQHQDPDSSSSLSLPSLDGSSPSSSDESATSSTTNTSNDYIRRHHQHHSNGKSDIGSMAQDHVNSSSSSSPSPTIKSNQTQRPSPHSSSSNRHSSSSASSSSSSKSSSSSSDYHHATPQSPQISYPDIDGSDRSVSSTGGLIVNNKENLKGVMWQQSFFKAPDKNFMEETYQILAEKDRNDGGQRTSLLDYWMSKIHIAQSRRSANICGNSQKKGKIKIRLVELMELQVEQSLTGDWR